MGLLNAYNIFYVDGATNYVGIGTSNPEEELHIKHPDGIGSHGLRIENSTMDGGDWTIYADNSTKKRLLFLPDGGSKPKAHVEHSTGNWVPTSDARMKKNIEPITNLISSIMLLNPTKYHMKGQSQTEAKTYGLLAQDVLKVFPGVVNYIEEADQYGLSYTEIIPILVAGMQEQQTEINALKIELKAYQNLEERMNALEAALKK